MADSIENYSVDMLHLVKDLNDAISKRADIEDDVKKSLQLQLDIAEKSLKSDDKRKDLDNKILNLQKTISKEKFIIAELTDRANKGELINAEAALEKLKTLFTTKDELQKLQDIKKRDLSLEDVITRAGYGRMVELVKLVKEYGIHHAVALTTLAGVGLILKHLITSYGEIDKAAAEFRKSIGITRDDSKNIEETARNITFNLAGVGVTAKDVYTSFLSVAKSIGTSQAVTKDMAENMSLLSVQLGVAQEDSAEFSRIMGQVGRTTMDAQKDMTLFVSKLSAAAGTTLNVVMADVANASKTSYQFLSKNPLTLAKAAVEAQRMGTSLTQAVSSAEKLVDFTNSVKSEMEASVLLGESVNLQRARELSYRRDIKGLNEEILNIAKKTKFEELDVFQQKAIADALGMSADNLGKMLQSDREIRRIRADGSLSKEVALYDQLRSANENIAKERAKDAKISLTELSNAEALKSLTLAIHGIVQQLARPLAYVAKFLTEIASGLNWLNNKIGAWSSGLVIAVDSVIDVLLILAGPLVIGKLLGSFTKLFGEGVGKGIGGFFTGISTGVKSMGESGVIKGAFGILILSASLIPLAFSLKLLQGLDWKTVGIMAVSLTFLASAAALIGLASELIIPGAIALGLLGLALLPFAFSAKIFSASLKSLEGVDINGIAAGIMKLSTAMFPLMLITPMLLPLSIGLTGLGLSLRFISSPLERVGTASEKIGSGLNSAVDALLKISNINLINTIKQFQDLSLIIGEISRSINTIPDVKIEKLENIVIKATQLGVDQAGKANEEIIKALQDIKSAVDALKMSLEKGGISSNVFIDAQRLDSATARSLAFRGPLSPQPFYS